jgi:hypothetical protein
MLSGYRGELPEALVLGLGVQGSFDSVAVSLRETATPLRMTGIIDSSGYVSKCQASR